jgi:hypothetical protein
LDGKGREKKVAFHAKLEPRVTLQYRHILRDILIDTLIDILRVLLSGLGISL